MVKGRGYRQKIADFRSRRILLTNAQKTIDLSTFPSSQGSVIDGPNKYDEVGSSVSITGDINGDGKPDFLIGAPATNFWQGAAYLVYGGQNGTINLGLFPNEQGFLIRGASLGDQAGAAVSGAGDFNKDGIPDLLVGAPYAKPGHFSNTGMVYVIYGGQDGLIDLSTFPSSQGVIIKGIAYSWTGWSVKGLPDVNKDGFADILIGVPAVNTFAGAAFLVYGGQNGTIELSTFSSNQGVVINGATKGDMAGVSVGVTEDMNGDEIPELLVGAPYARPNNQADAGSAFLIYSEYTDTVELSTFPSKQGMVVNGDVSYQVGWSVSGLGDVSKDKIPDFVVGAPGVNYYIGAAFVVNGGQNGTIELSRLLKSQGFKIQGDTAGAQLGVSVSGTRDLNGDGAAEVIVGAPHTGRNEKGMAYLVYGGQNGTVDVATLQTSQGLIIQGAVPGDQVGVSVAGLAGKDSQNVSDLLIGAWGGNSNTGASYLVHEQEIIQKLSKAEDIDGEKIPDISDNNDRVSTVYALSDSHGQNFYKRGIKYLSSFFYSVSDDDIKREEQRRLDRVEEVNQYLDEVEHKLAELIPMLNLHLQLGLDVGVNTKVLDFYQAKVSSWRKLADEISTQDLKVLNDDVSILTRAVSFGGLEYTILTSEKSQFNSKQFSTFAFFRPVDVMGLSSHAQAALTAQTNMSMLI